MKFGRFLIADAQGVVLAHAVRAGTTLRKGHVLTAADVQALAAAGIAAVMGARLAPEDVSEDAAAARIGTCLAGGGLDISAARTGRCNLTATKDGIVTVDAAAVTAANLVDEAVTIATVPDKSAVARGQVVATVKIIPFAVGRDVLEQIARHLKGYALSAAPYRAKKYALISTLLPHTKTSVVSATEAVTRARVEQVGGAIISCVRIAHESEVIAAEIAAARSAGADVVLIVGASATADRADTVPAGILIAGGVIDHFGMPVDPGNLLVLAHVGNIPTLVLPGCARSPKLNGADWVLQRLAADVPITGADIMKLGVGGLLGDTPSRPLPRARAVRVFAPEPRAIAAIVLAGGQSRRMGQANKLLMEIDGVPLVRRAVAAAMASKVDRVVVVTGHQDQAIKQALEGLDVTMVHNARYAEGLSTSLKAGIAALSGEVAGAVICLGDMPGVETRHLDLLVEAFDPSVDRAICIATHAGKRGNPILWDSRFFPDMCAVTGDVGARHLIGENESLVYEVEFDDTGVLMDLDTPGQWEDFLSQSSPPRST